MAGAFCAGGSDMTQNTKYLIAGVIVTACIVWLASSFERVTEREEIGLQGEAARNPLLAFTRLLERMGREVRPIASVSAIEQLDRSATLVLPRGRAAYTRERAERVRAWVESGGHLIVEAEFGHERDRVLEALKVRRQRLEQYVQRKPLATLALPHVSEPLRVRLYAGLHLIDDDPARTVHVQKDSSGTLVLHLIAGQGRVTVLPTFEFMSNAAIGDHDHAALAWSLARWAPASHTVVIAPRFDSPSIFEWLAREARLALFTAAALIVLALWRVGTRFGPVEPAPQSDRRRLLDHLRASGRFLWRAGAALRLLTAVREACLQRLARTRPALAALPDDARTQRLAELTQVPLKDMELAWHGEPDTPAGFAAAVGTLQNVEEKLTRTTTVRHGAKG